MIECVTTGSFRIYWSHQVSNHDQGKSGIKRRLGSFLLRPLIRNPFTRRMCLAHSIPQKGLQAKSNSTTYLEEDEALSEPGFIDSKDTASDKMGSRRNRRSRENRIKHFQSSDSRVEWEHALQQCTCLCLDLLFNLKSRAWSGVHLISVVVSSSFFVNLPF